MAYNASEFMKLFSGQKGSEVSQILSENFIKLNQRINELEAEVNKKQSASSSDVIVDTTGTISIQCDPNVIVTNNSSIEETIDVTVKVMYANMELKAGSDNASTQFKANLLTPQIKSNGVLIADVTETVKSNYLHYLVNIKPNVVNEGALKFTITFKNQTYSYTIPVIVVNSNIANNGQGVFVSNIFTRSEQRPITPSGGSYQNPLPNNAGWSDGIPSGSGSLYTSHRTFTSDGLAPQTDSWSTPVLAQDTTEIDFAYSSYNNGTPQAPSNHGVHDGTDTYQWHDEGVEDDIWMAISVKAGGEYGAWSVLRIKGEDGINGDYTTHFYKESEADSVNRPTATKPDDLRNEINPDSVNYGWKDGPDADGIWWMTTAIVDGTTGCVIGDWTLPIRVTAGAGTPGSSVYNSTVFISAENPSKPTGGNFSNPIPSGWSDGIPESTNGHPIWSSHRIFTSNGKAPQESSWSAPVKLVDSADFDCCYSSYNEGVPNDPSNHGTQNDSIWHNVGTSNDIWMATSHMKNGVWSAWTITKIKGENGKEADYVNYIFKQSATETLSQPNLNIPSNFIGKANNEIKNDNGSVNTEACNQGWQDAPGVGDNWWMSMAVIDGSTGKVDSSTSANGWSTPIKMQGADGKAGADGSYMQYQYSINTSATQHLAENSAYWFDTVELAMNGATSIPSGSYMWLRQRKFSGNPLKAGSWSYMRVTGEKGEDGTSININGELASFDELFAKTNVTDGTCYTVNGYLFTYNTSSDYVKYSDLSDIQKAFYNLTTEANPSYWINCGKVSGVDGKNAYIHVKYAKLLEKVGDGGKLYPTTMYNEPQKYIGILVDNNLEANDENPSLYTWSQFTGNDGYGYEYIYKLSHTKTNITIPTIAECTQLANGKVFADNDYVPNGWTDNPSGISAEYPYEYMAKRCKVDGQWGAFLGSVENTRYAILYAYQGMDAPYEQREWAVFASLTLTQAMKNATTWSEVIPSVPSGSYLWERTRTVTPSRGSQDETMTEWQYFRRTGEKGNTGTGLQIKGSVETYEQLFALTNVMDGDCYLLNGHIWTWAESAQSLGANQSLYNTTLPQKKWRDGGNIQGEKGQSGATAYIHIKYADKAEEVNGVYKVTNKSWLTTLTTANDGEAPGRFMGIYTDHNELDENGLSTKYTWSKNTGDDGIDYEYIYTLTNTSTAPDVPYITDAMANGTDTQTLGEQNLTYQNNDFIPIFNSKDKIGNNLITNQVWYDDPVSTSETTPYLWACKREKINKLWGKFTGSASDNTKCYLYTKFAASLVDIQMTNQLHVYSLSNNVCNVETIVCEITASLDGVILPITSITVEGEKTQFSEIKVVTGETKSTVTLINKPTLISNSNLEFKLTINDKTYSKFFVYNTVINGTDGINGDWRCYVYKNFDGTSLIAPNVNDPSTFSSITDKANQNYGWQDGPEPEGIWWMSTALISGITGLVSGSWSTPIRITPETATDGQSVYMSTVFKRAESVTTPTGGTYNSPVPSDWSEAIPEEDNSGNPIWSSYRKFTSDGKAPQDATWSTPVKMVDSADFDCCYSSYNKGVPTAPTNHGVQSSSTWHNVGTSNDIWMATSHKKNGVWSSWTITKIKGENGADADYVNYIFKQSDAETVSQPTLKVPNNFIDKADNEIKNDNGSSNGETCNQGWKDAPSSGNNWWMSMALISGSTGKVSDEGWSTPIKLQGADGKDGANGTNGEYTEFQYAKSTSTVSYPSSTSSDWKTSAPTLSSNEYLWMRQRRYSGNPLKAGAWSYMRVTGEKGQDGSNGTSVKLKGEITTFDALFRLSNPTDGDSYVVKGYLFTYNKSVTPVTYASLSDKEKAFYNLSTPYPDPSYWVNCGKIQGKDGEDGTNQYVHVKYASALDQTSNGKTYPSSMSDTPNTYMGMLVDDNETANEDASYYTWTKIVGEDGKNGKNGTNGSYTKYQYQINTSSTTPDTSDSKWSDNANSLGSVTSGKYLWMRHKRFDGNNTAIDENWTYTRLTGDKGEKGQSGTSAYIHVKYASVLDQTSNGKSYPTSMSDTPSTYIGVLVDTTVTASTTPSKYTWSRFTGEDGYGYEYIYRLSATKVDMDVPAISDETLNSDKYQSNDYTPTVSAGSLAWTDNPTGISAEYPYEYMAKRCKVDGKWGKFTGQSTSPSKAILYAYQGMDAPYIQRQWAIVQATVLSDTVTSAPYQSTIPNVPSGYYLWERSRTVTPARGGSSETYTTWSYYRITGEKGNTGSGIQIKGTVNSTSDLDNITTKSDGDCYLINGHIYTWSDSADKWVDGGNIKGETGDSGKTAYIHIKYAKTATLSGSTYVVNEEDLTGNNGEDAGNFIGICTDFTATDPTDLTKYTWSKNAGDDGIDYEYIYCRTKTNSAPNVPDVSTVDQTLYQKPDYNPDNKTWTDDPVDVTEQYPYQWACKREKVNGSWGAFYGNSANTGKCFLYNKFAFSSVDIQMSQNNAVFRLRKDGASSIPSTTILQFSATKDGEKQSMSFDHDADPNYFTIRNATESNKVYTITVTNKSALVTSGSIKFTLGVGGKTYVKVFSYNVVKDGNDGNDATDYEYVFTTTAENKAPNAPTIAECTQLANGKVFSDNDYVPSGWTDDPVSLTEDEPYQWCSKREKKSGSWGAFGTPYYYNHLTIEPTVLYVSPGAISLGATSGGTIPAQTITLNLNLKKGESELISGITSSNVTVTENTSYTVKSFTPSTGILILNVSQHTLTSQETFVVNVKDSKSKTYSYRVSVSVSKQGGNGEQGKPGIGIDGTSPYALTWTNPCLTAYEDIDGNINMNSFTSELIVWYGDSVLLYGTGLELVQISYDEVLFGTVYHQRGDNGGIYVEPQDILPDSTKTNGVISLVVEVNGILVETSVPWVINWMGTYQKTILGDCVTEISSKVTTEIDSRGLITSQKAQTMVNQSASGLTTQITNVKNTVDGHTTSINNLNTSANSFSAKIQTLSGATDYVSGRTASLQVTTNNISASLGKFVNPNLMPDTFLGLKVMGTNNVVSSGEFPLTKSGSQTYLLSIKQANNMAVKVEIINKDTNTLIPLVNGSTYMMSCLNTISLKFTTTPCTCEVRLTYWGYNPTLSAPDYDFICNVPLIIEYAKLELAINNNPTDWCASSVETTSSNLLKAMPYDVLTNSKEGGSWGNFNTNITKNSTITRASEGGLKYVKMVNPSPVSTWSFTCPPSCMNLAEMYESFKPIYSWVIMRQSNPTSSDAFTFGFEVADYGKETTFPDGENTTGFITQSSNKLPLGNGWFMYYQALHGRQPMISASNLYAGRWLAQQTGDDWCDGGVWFPKERSKRSTIASTNDCISFPFSGVADTSINPLSICWYSFENEFIQSILEYENDKEVANELLMKNDTWYTLSFWARNTANNSGPVTSYIYNTSNKAVSDGGVGFYTIGNTTERLSSTNADNSHKWNFTNDWQRYSYTFKTNSEVETNYNNEILFRIDSDGNGKSYNLEIADIRFENAACATNRNRFIDSSNQYIGFSNIIGDWDILSWGASRTGYPSANELQQQFGLNSTLSSMLETGINVIDGQITLTADKVRVIDNKGNQQALFENGGIKTSWLKANVIDAINARFDYANVQSLKLNNACAYNKSDGRKTLEIDGDTGSLIAYDKNNNETLKLDGQTGLGTFNGIVKAGLYMGKQRDIQEFGDGQDVILDFNKYPCTILDVSHYIFYSYILPASDYYIGLEINCIGQTITRMGDIALKADIHSPFIIYPYSTTYADPVKIESIGGYVAGYKILATEDGWLITSVTGTLWVYDFNGQGYTYSSNGVLTKK